MKTKRINGLYMEKMLQNGLANLCLHETELNNLNVFPVADGDTGTNMRATLESGLNSAKSVAPMGTYLKLLTDAMLFGAHGNSGVILSQLFRGFFVSLSRCGTVNPVEFRNALISAYKTAYAAVIRPVEGTILTVAREGIEHIKDHIDRNTTFEELLSMYIAEMKKSLSHTPEVLQQLKDAGVVDSGAKGYIFIIDGMLKYLYGDIIKNNNAVTSELPKNQSVDDNGLFNENSIFESGYCVEFILQLLNGEKYSGHFNLNRFISDLQDYGGSIVAVQDGKRIKVHIHTFKPSKVLALGQEFGEFVTCKIENMQVQHNSVMQKKQVQQEHKAFAIISVSDSDETGNLFSDLGCSYVINSNDNMDVSVQEFVNALKNVNADKVAVLPNSSNLIRVAAQAKELCGFCEVIIIESKTIPEGYCALAMDVSDEINSDIRIKQMLLGIKDVITLSLTISGNKGNIDNISNEDNFITLAGKKILSSGNQAGAVFFKGICSVPQIDSKESCIIIRGKNVPQNEEDNLKLLLSKAYPNLEVSFIDGGSYSRYWMAAIS